MVSSYINTMIKQIKSKISKITRALQTYMAGSGTLGISRATYFPPGGGGVPKLVFLLSYIVKKKMQARANTLQLSPLRFPLDKKTKQSRQLSRSYVSLARFCVFVNAFLHFLVDFVIFRNHSDNQADDYANQASVQINHVRGPPFSLTVSGVSRCPI
tara:strand:- start:107 stop:577 length:471 start_codon:yes stop_codon:yes gene_type:complete